MHHARSVARPRLATRWRSLITSVLSLAIVALAWSAGALALTAGPSVALASAAASTPKAKVTLKDGRVIEGEIVRELDGNVWIKHSIAGVMTESFFTATQVASIDRGGASAAPSAPVTQQPATEAAPVAPGVTRLAVITLGDRANGDMVGLYITVHALQQMLPMLEKELGTDGRGVLVLRISSGGGALIEMLKLAEYIHEEFKPRFRTVAWIDTAISAAAMLSHSLEEIYFTPQGNYGAATGWFGNLTAIKGMDLEEVLYFMEQVSAKGGHDPLIMRAMQIQQPLSATIDENGKVTYYPDATSGQILVNREGEVLTFNAQTALAVKFSQGTAATLDELIKLMKLGEVQVIGKDVPNIPFPVGKAEEWNMDWRKQVKQDEDRSREFLTNYQQAVAAAQSEPDRTRRGGFVNRARSQLNRIKQIGKTNPNSVLFVLNADPEGYQRWVDDQERLLRELMR